MASSNLNVTTNNVPRDVVEGFELTPAERAEFDYIDWQAIEDGRESASFIRYRGELVDLGEFEVWDNPDSPTRQGWDGVRPDSYFSGLVVRYVDDCERVVVGRYSGSDGAMAQEANSRAVLREDDDLGRNIEVVRAEDDD